MFILISFFTSCKKTVLKIKVRGEVVGLTGGEPIPDADVYIIRHQETDMFSYGISEEVYRSKTKHKGEFEFDFKRERGWKYTLYARKKEYFDEESTRGVQSYFYINRPIKLFKSELKLYLLEPSFINLKVKNVSNYDSTYRVSFRNIYEGSYLLGFNCKNGEALYNNLIIPADTDYYSTYFITDSQYNLIKDGEVLIPKRSPFSVTDLYLEY